MSTNNPDFSDTELSVIYAALKERYGKEVETHLADAEIQLDPDSEDHTEVPVVFWREREASFILCKITNKRFTGSFFYNPRDPFRTVQKEFNEAGDCILALLRGQADYEAQRAGNL